MDPVNKVLYFYIEAGQVKLSLSIIPGANRTFTGGQRHGKYSVSESRPGNNYVEHFMLATEAKNAFVHYSLRLAAEQQEYFRTNPYMEQLLKNKDLREWDDIIFDERKI